MLASANPGKVRELSALVAPHGIRVVPISDFVSGELVEDGQTFEDNALQKARYATSVSGLPALSDDSGFCVAGLGGQPGIHSARWAGASRDFSAAMERVRQTLDSTADPSAHFVCVLAICFPDSTSLTFRGEVHGRFCWPPRGQHGFGYDPVFIPDGHDRTFAEMSPDEKEALSHRRHAFDQFCAAVLAPPGDHADD